MQKKNKLFPFLATVTAATVAGTVMIPTAHAASFSDIQYSEYKEAIEKLSKEGIIHGYKGGLFQPTKQLTRSDVVKMLGKYLVSQGYTVPSDYKTYMRFRDLSPNSQDELLRYAALVYDHGIFTGNQGQLLASDKLSMQHMALVLVRALSTIDGFDYISYVEEQRFLKDYLDLDLATAEAQKAINVIDYYDFYRQAREEAYFYPKNIATRGQFAHFLYHLLEIKSPVRNQPNVIGVSSIEVLSPTRLTVILTDDTVHNVTLTRALTEHVPRSVTFRLQGRTYTQVVTYKPKELKVVNASFINSGQFAIEFNREVSLKDTYHADDLAKVLQLKPATGTYQYTLTRGELSKDHRTFMVTLGENIPVNTNYRIELLNIHTEDGFGLFDYTEGIYYGAHHEGPRIKEVTNLGDYKVRVDFSEPIHRDYSTYSIRYRLADGTPVTDVKATFQENRRFSSVYDQAYSYFANYVTFDLSNAKANGNVIWSTTPIYVEFPYMQDIAGNLTNPSPLTTTIQKVWGDTKDGTAPKLSKVEQVGAKKIKLTFSEAVRQIGYYDLTFQSSKKHYYVEELEQSADQKSFILTMDDYLEGDVMIKTRTYSYVYDVSGESATINRRYSFTYDNRPAEIIGTEVIREYNKEYLFVTFDRPVVLGTDPKVLWENGQYEQGRQVSNMLSQYEARVYPAGDHQVKIPVANLLQPTDFEHALYRGDLVFKDVENEYAVQVKPAAVSFVRGKDYFYNTEQLKLLAVETSRTNPAIVDSNRIFLQFNYPVDEEKAADVTNYSLSGYTIQSAQVSKSDPKQVELVVANTISAPVSPYLSVSNLTAEKSVLEMDFYYERTYLNENIAPVYQSAAKTGTREITITYNEAIAMMDPNAFLVHDSAGQLIEQTASNHPTDQTKIVLTFAENISTYGTYTINLRTGRDVRDLYGNKANFSKLSVYR